MTTLSCCCGTDHTASPSWPTILKLVVEFGETTVVTVAGQGSWNVPRAYIGMHGIKAVEVPALADKYGWTAAN